MAVRIRVPVATLKAQLDEAIAAAAAVQGSGTDVQVFRSAYQTWDKRNEIMLEQAFKAGGWLDSTPKGTYANAFGLEYPFGPELAQDVTTDGLTKDLTVKVERLAQIRDTLDAYAVAETDHTATPTTSPAVSSQGDIFVVHGRSDAARLEVDLLIRRATSRNPIVLAKQANQGATIIEKLEAHLNPASSSFAIVIMTADDVGRLAEADEEEHPRARQNVVLELGFAMGVLGRRRVAILHEEGVELPSDITGVAFYPLDKAGAWKVSLLGELKAADIEVDPGALL